MDGPAGTTDCNLDKPCDATHSLAHECDSNVTCITTEDPCGTEYVCIACPPASPAVSSACGPVDDYCSISWTGDPYCWTDFKCGSDGMWQWTGHVCE